MPFPKAGDCLCVLATRCLVMFPVAGEEVFVFVFLAPSCLLRLEMVSVF